MIRLDFKVEPALIAFNIIKYGAKRFFIDKYKGDVDDLCTFRDKLWERDPATCQFIRDGIDQPNIVLGNSAQMAQKTETLLQTVVHDPLFKPLISQTMEALSQVREEWEHNYQQSFNIMTELTGLKLNKEIPVYMTHPAIRNGMNYLGKIFWTYRQDFPNYNTIYLWHEIMHGFIPPAGHGDAAHVVVQLLTDEELRARLNGITYPPLEGHEYLRPLELSLLPAWREYLKQDKKDIWTFVKTAQDAEEKLKGD
jgi:hypothetical protein